MAKTQGGDLFNFVRDAVKTFLVVLYYIGVAVLAWLQPTRYKNINDDVILITGGGRGVGRRLALEFAKYQPKHIILWGRHADTLSSTCKEVVSQGVSCSYRVCDVSQKEQISQQAEWIRETVGDVTMLVNNAGIVYGQPIIESRDEDIENTIHVNTLAHFWTLKAFLPAMVKKNHGHIVTINSMLGLVGLSGAGDYSTSKYASTGLAESLLFELQDEMQSPDINVTIVYPYQIANAMFAGCKPRFPSLFPPIKEDYVAQRTVHAVLTNQIQMVLPRMMYFLWWSKSWLPVPALLSLFRFLGVDRAMETFEGGARPMVDKGNI